MILGILVVRSDRTQNRTQPWRGGEVIGGAVLVLCHTGSYSCSTAYLFESKKEKEKKRGKRKERGGWGEGVGDTPVTTPFA